jgi:hypothetical protein
MHWATTTFASKPTTLARMYTSFKRTSLSLREKYAPANLTIAFSIQSVPAAAPVTNPNSLGFDPDSDPEKRLLNIGIALQHDDFESTDDLERATQKLTMEIDQIAIADGVNDRHLYLNYAGSWQNVFAGYGSDSVEDMRRVSKRYDEKRMFQRQVKGGYKLGSYRK